jgi:long-chain acyl-CoA synthetase
MSVRTEVSGAPARSVHPLWFLDRFDEWADSEPARFGFAVDHPDRVEEYTYGEVQAMSRRVAAALRSSGVAPGDRVGILMDNSPAWVFALLGLLRIGAVGVPLSTLLPAASVRRLVDHAECRVVFTDAGNRSTALEALRGRGSELIVHGPEADGMVSWEVFLDRGAAEGWTPAPSPDGTAVLMYTSGTTGDPKGVQISALGISVDVAGLVELLELSPDHRILSVLPFSHVLPLVANGLGALAAGCGVVFLPAISPQRIVDAFKKHRITFFVCVPQFFYAVHKRIFDQVASQPWPLRKVFGLMFAASKLIGSPRVRRRLFSKIHQSVGPDLSLLVTGGSRVEPRIAQDFQTLGYTMIQAYGLTETSAAATLTPVSRNVIGTVGVPIRGVSIRIDQPNEEGIGEVAIAGDILMLGYYRDPESTSRAVRDGWFYSGDLGRLDAAGNLTITGRSKDVIVLASGKNIYPEEVEEHYEKCPYIKEMCVMGLPEPGGPGDTLHAVIVPDLEEFRKRSQTAIAEMIRYEIENRSRDLASFMRVHSIEVRNEPLPRTLTRKLKRFEIYDQEVRRIHSKEEVPKGSDHDSFRDGIGAVIARRVREAKPACGVLGPDSNLDLDLGFDSLGRVELLSAVESDLGTSIPEEETHTIFTLGELLAALEAAGRGGEGGGSVSWKDKLAESDPATEALTRRYVPDSRLPLTLLAFPAIRVLGLIARAPFRTRVQGLEHLPERGPYIICPNHLSYLDPFLLCSVLPFRVIRDIFILGYTDYLEGPLTRPLARVANIVPVDPNANLTRAMRVSASGLKRGRILLVFPEGERSITGGLTEFKKGASILAAELRVKLVPVGIRGTFEAWPRGGKLKAHPVEIRVGEPVDPAAFDNSPDPYKAINDELKARIQALIR